MEISKLLSHNADTTMKMSTLSQNLHRLRQFTQESLGVIQQRMLSLENGGGSNSGSPAFERTQEYQRMVQRVDVLEGQAKSYVCNTRRDSETSNLDVEVSVLKRRLDQMENTTNYGEEHIGSGSGQGWLEMLTRRVTKLKDNSDIGGSGLPSHDDSDIKDGIDGLAKRLDKAEARGSDEIF
jgi:hypothetical protein